MKPLIKLASGLALLAAPVLADVSVHVDLGGPPPPRQEVVVQSPGPDYVWVGGYWGGDPGHYAWVPGHWERPPRRGEVWVAPRWDRDHDGHYHMERGEWRDRGDRDRDHDRR